MSLHGTITLEAVPMSTKYYNTPIDYSDAFREAEDIFLDEATSLVPVDTGLLRSSITAESGYYRLDAYADTDYAEYVEYGTYKMAAQPYFEPALADAADAARAAALDIYREAQQEDTQRYVEEAQKQSEEKQAQLFDTLGGFLGAIIAMLIASIFQTLIDEITGEADDGAGIGANYDVDID